MLVFDANRVIVEAADAPADVSTPYTIQPGDLFRGAVDHTEQPGIFPSDTDWVRIELQAGQAYRMIVQGESADEPGRDLSTELRISDQSGTTIAYNDGLTAITQVSGYGAYLPPATGTYYLGPSSLSGLFEGPYELFVEPIPQFTVPQIAQQLTDGYWQANGGQRRSWDIAPGDTLTVDISQISDVYSDLIGAALLAWTDVSGIRFDVLPRQPFGVAAPDADIYFTGDSGPLAQVQGNATTITSATINTGLASVVFQGNAVDGQTYQDFLAQIGFALGLGQSRNAVTTAVFGIDNIYANDTIQTTVMSGYTPRVNPIVDAEFDFVVTPMIADVLAIQQLYGPPAAVNAGSTLYGFGAPAAGGLGAVLAELTGTLDSPFVNGEVVGFTITDTAGRDRFDFRTDTEDQVIDARPGGISTIYGHTGNMTVALNTVIEEAIAGSGNDVVIGNAAANLLAGLDGADTLYGLSGADRLLGGNDNDTILGHDNNDNLLGEAGDDLLQGGTGLDILQGGPGDDTNFGGAGADRHVFRAGLGQDVIGDFVPGEDILLFERSISPSATTPAAFLAAHATAGAGGVLLSFGGGNSVLLEGVASPGALVDDVVFF